MATNKKVHTNFRITLTIGASLERSTVADGRGYAPNLQEAKSRFDSVRKKTRQVLKAELYFEDKLIKKV